MIGKNVVKQEYKCPYCGAIVKLSPMDISYFGNSMKYYYCPECEEYPLISKGTLKDQLYKPCYIGNEKAILIDMYKE